MTYLSQAGGAFGATGEVYPKRIETEDTMSEWRKCAHCRRRYLWRESWPSELCPRCHKRLERAKSDETEQGHTTAPKAAGNAGNAPQEAQDGQYWLPGCDPLSL
jgi:hypothetical protein